jgi:hypothetical protein
MTTTHHQAQLLMTEGGSTWNISNILSSHYLLRNITEELKTVAHHAYANTLI